MNGKILRGRHITVTYAHGLYLTSGAPASGDATPSAQRRGTADDAQFTQECSNDAIEVRTEQGSSSHSHPFCFYKLVLTNGRGATEREIGSRRWRQSCSSLRKHRPLAPDLLSRSTHHSQRNRAQIHNPHQIYLSRRHRPQSQYRGQIRHYLWYRGCRRRRWSQAPCCLPPHRARPMRDSKG